MFDNVFVTSNRSKYILINMKNAKSLILSKKSFKELTISIRNGNNIKNLSFKEELLSLLKDDEPVLRQVEPEQSYNPVLMLSYDCNYDCLYCYQRDIKGITTKIEIEDIPRIDSFYDKFCSHYNIEKKYGTIYLTGGEPLLPDNSDVIDAILMFWKENRFIIKTNGSYIFENRDKLLKINCEFHVSVDGVYETHSKRRISKSKDNYKDTLLGIDWALSNDKKVVILSIFYPDNIDQYSHFFDLLEHLGWLKTDNLAVQFSLELNNGCDDICNEYYIEAIIAFDNLRKKDKRAYYISIPKFFPGSGFLIENLMHVKTGEYQPYRCNCLIIPSYSFAPDGKVYMCNLVADDCTYIGEYKEHIFINFNKIETIKKRNIDEMENCKHCDWKLACGGGCFITGVKGDGNLLNPSCGQWQNLKSNIHLQNIMNHILFDVFTE